MEEATALRRGNRDRDDLAHVFEGRVRRAEEMHPHRHDDLALDEQVDIEGERVGGDAHRSFECVLDGSEAHVNLAVVHRVEHVEHRGHRHELGGGQVGLRQHRLLGERAEGAEEGDALRRGERPVMRRAR